MPKTLADLRQSPHVGLPEQTHKLCLSGKLYAEFTVADEAFFEAQGAAEVARERADEAARDADDVPRRPRRAGEGSEVVALREAADAAEAVADEKAADVDRIRELMAEHTVEVTVRAKQDGDWRTWCAAHPAREDDRRDTTEFAGLCDADALIAAAGDWVTAVNGAPLKPGDWDFVTAAAAPGDVKELAKRIVRMQERGVDLGKSRGSWLSGRRNVTGSA